MSEKTATQQLVQELLEEMRYVRAHTSRTAELLATGVKNNVLQVETVTFPASGMIDRSWQAVCGAVAVRNLSTSALVIVAGGPPSVAPSGVGSWTVPVGKLDVVNVNSRIVTFYGTGGEKICFQAFTTGAPVEVSAS